MDAARLYAIAAFVAGLIITLFLAAYLTPRSWWRRPNARALLIMVVGAWGFGSLILYATHGPAAATNIASTPPAPAPIINAAANAAPANDAPTAGQAFHVHRDLNLRAAPGVHSARVTTVQAGALVTPTGVHDGDWWQIKTIINGRETSGWASSLWLRRRGE